MRKYGKIAALAMAMRGKGNDGQTATFAMATHTKCDDGQNAGAQGNRDVGQVDSLRGECNDGQIVALAIATSSKGNDRKVAGAWDGHARQRQRRANHRRTQQQQC